MSRAKVFPDSSGGDRALSLASLLYFFVASFLLPFFSLNLEMLSLARLAEFLAFFAGFFATALAVATVWEISPAIVLEFRLFKLELYCLCNFWFGPILDLGSCLSSVCPYGSRS
jgi:hypothetical protein